MRRPVRLLAPDRAPASIEVHEAGGMTLVVESVWAPGPAPTLVLLHGIGMGRSVFASLAERWDGRIIAVDLPGFGEAPEPEGAPSMADHAELVASYLRSSGERECIVFGHSMGSQIAAELAARHPDLLSGLVLAGPTVNRAARGVLVQALALGRDLIAERPRVLVRGAREYLRGGPHLVRKMRATVAHKPEDAYGRIECPALVIRGAHDPLAPVAWCREIVRRIPNATLVEIPGQGHGTLISDPGPVVDEVRRFAVRIGADGPSS